MTVTIKAGRAAGSVVVPPSKSVAHRLLINAAMCAGESTLCNLPTNEDIAATVDCLRAMGAQITLDGKGNCTVRGFGGRAETAPRQLCCRESGSTLRFLIPVAMLDGIETEFSGSERLFQRPLSIYSDICREQGLLWQPTDKGVRVCGKLTAGEAEVALLPEPHVSIACAQSEKVHIALSANELWQAHNEGTLVQGVYIVRRDYLDAHKEAVDQFLLDAAASAEKVLTEENAPAAVVEMGIIGKEPIAKRAIPNCNIVLKTGEEMRSLVSDMLAVLHKANPKSVGGNLPDTEFYYVP